MCSKYFIHDFQIVLSDDFKTESELYKKYEKQPESKIYKQVVNIYEYIEHFFEQFSVGLSSPSIKMVFCTELKENGFAKLVDSNHHLIGFNDGVYDIDRYESANSFIASLKTNGSYNFKRSIPIIVSKFLL